MRTSLLLAGVLAAGLLVAPPAWSSPSRTEALPVAGDPLTPVRVHDVRHNQVPVGRWSWVTVSIELDERYDQVLVQGSAQDDGLRARKAVESDVAAGLLHVRLPVRLAAESRCRLVVRVLATGERSASSSRMTQVRPRR